MCSDYRGLLDRRAMKSGNVKKQNKKKDKRKKGPIVQQADETEGGGYDQVVPVFRNTLEPKLMRLMQPGQIMKEMGNEVFNIFGNAMQNLVQNGMLPDAKPGDVFRRIFAVHILFFDKDEVGQAQLQEQLPQRMDEIAADEFVGTLLNMEYYDEFRRAPCSGQHG